MYVQVGLLFTLTLLDYTYGANSDASHFNQGYNIDFMKELCRYVGVSYVRNPQDPLCKYIWCWNGYPYSMECPPGRMVHPYFYWSEKDPCTESDTGERCLLGVLKQAHRKRQREREQEAELDSKADKNTMIVEQVKEEEMEKSSRERDSYHDTSDNNPVFSKNQKYYEVDDL